MPALVPCGVCCSQHLKSPEWRRVAWSVQTFALPIWSLGCPLVELNLYQSYRQIAISLVSECDWYVSSLLLKLMERNVPRHGSDIYVQYVHLPSKHTNNPKAMQKQQYQPT